MSIMPEQQFYTARVLEKVMLTKDIVQFKLERPADFEFQAGQFVQFQVPDDEKPVLRSYSISSAPSEPELEFCAKILPDGKASQHFDRMKIGDSLLMSKARGAFISTKDTSNHKVYIATGTGIAPVMSMLKAEITMNTKSTQASVLQTTALDAEIVVEPGVQRDETKLDVIFGVRFEEDLFWQDRLEALKSVYEKLATIITLSRPGEQWTGKKGRVTDYVSSLPVDAHYYICGSVEMVKDARKLLLEKGVNTKSIHLEIF